VDPFKPRAGHGPEYFIQDRWVTFLEGKGWHVERLTGNAFQHGIPDLYLGHPEHGCRWVDIKVYGRYSFTKSQRLKWPIWERYGIGIWILGADSKETCTKEHMIQEHEILFGSPNWRDFWRSSWDEKPDIDKMLEELDDAS
jgi:hypothetical protein